MLISLLLLILIASGGLALTYLVTDDEPLLWRVSAGTVIGSAFFGIIAFTAACLAGFSVVTILVPLALTMLPLVLLRRRNIRGRFLHDLAKARGTLQGANLKKARRFAYYAAFFVLFWVFFGRAMFEMSDGIYTGGSQNLGDLPFHLGAIFGFTDGNNFPPQNPSWAGARFSYPFIADFLTACFVKLGADVKDAMFVQNVSWAFALFVILERFVVQLTGSKLAGRIAPALLFLSGGLGFIWFFKDVWESGKGLYDLVWHLPRDYSIGEHFRWGNSMVALFITQRSLLLGMPITIFVLGHLWQTFGDAEIARGRDGEKAEDAGKAGGRDAGNKTVPSPASLRPRVPASFLVGLIAGTLPLIHLHSLAALFVVTAFLFVLRPARWAEWVSFGVGVVVVAVPELVWSLSGTANEAAKFFEWHFGWDKRDDNFLWFWLKNTGIVIPAIVAGILIYRRTDGGTGGRRDAETKIAASRRPAITLVLFYIPFIFLFVVSNVAKLAPWEWDNIKIIVYWYVGSLPLIALALAWGWQREGLAKVAVALCFAVLIFAGALDVWRTSSGQIKSRVFDADAVEVAAQIKKKTPPGALFLNAPTYNSAVVLSGRQSLMRYSGHLSSHGIDYTQREADVRHIYEGGGVADIFLRKYNIEYVLVSPEERGALRANEEFFRKYPVIAESGQYKVYKVK